MLKLDMKTPNFTDENIAKIAELFPNCVTETQDDKGNLIRGIDFDLLRQELSANIVEGQKERYQINWPGKREALVKANEPINKTLRPCREESVNFDTTQNLYIEGDNLEALKLLQESYLGKIKMIYIDPPYNTGKDFVYSDNFTMDSEEYDLFSGNVSEEGGRLVANTESNGRFHSDWLSMMYSRLKIARNLLKNDGVVFISIDDNEIHNLRKICDEIFGENSYVSTIAWQKTLTRRNDAKLVSSAHEYILIYAKDSQTVNFNKLEPDEKQRATYTNRDNDPRGDWLAIPFHAPNLRPNLTYLIVTPGGREIMPPSGRCWSTTKEKYEELVLDNRIYFGQDGNGMPQRKKFWSESDNGMVAWTWWSYEFAGENRSATKEIKEIFDNNSPFSAPKPTKLLRRILDISSTESNEIILDFFSGSSTCAHAVMQKNVKENRNLRYIMVQLPEETDESSEAYKAGYKHIAEIGKERIRRAGQKILQENQGKEGIENLDIGFRVLKVDSSNMKDVYYTPDEITRQHLPGTVENIKEDRTPEDLLFQVLLDWGVDLMLPIVREEILGKTVYFVDGDTLAACFDDGIDEAFVKELAKREVMRVVFKETGFARDDIKDNVEQIFKELSPDTEVRAI